MNMTRLGELRHIQKQKTEPMNYRIRFIYCTQSYQTTCTRCLYMHTSIKTPTEGENALYITAFYSFISPGLCSFTNKPRFVSMIEISTSRVIVLWHGLEWCKLSVRDVYCRECVFLSAQVCFQLSLRVEVVGFIEDCCKWFFTYSEGLCYAILETIRNMAKETKSAKKDPF